MKKAEFFLAYQAPNLFFLPGPGAAERIGDLGPEKAAALRRDVEAAMARAKEPAVLASLEQPFAGMVTPLSPVKTPLGIVAEAVYYALESHLKPRSFVLRVVGTVAAENALCDWDGSLLASVAADLAGTKDDKA